MIVRRALSFLNAIYMRGDKRVLNSSAKTISRKKKSDWKEITSWLQVNDITDS